MNTILKSYKKVVVKKAITKNDAGDGKEVPAGDYVLRHSDKNHTILWPADGTGAGHVISTPNYLTRKASGLIQ